MKILLIDDDHNIAAFIKLAMEDNNYEVDIAFDGIAGKKMADENQYDVVILDVMLPGMDGFELCKKIRNTAKDARILLFTSLDSEEDKVMAYLSGADNILTKSFNLKELNSKIMQWTMKSAQIPVNSFSLR
jgi:two-component system copper resistance phosphate regulon response regulator CusR